MASSSSSATTTTVDISTTAQFKKLVGDFSGKFIAVFFYADFHEPSKKGGQMDSLYVQLSKQHRQEALFLRVDAEEEDCEELADRFGVETVPTFAFLDAKGEILSSFSGADAPKLASTVSKLASKAKGASLSSSASASASSSSAEKLNARLKQLINAAPVMLFMKGSPADPYCKFSRKVVNLLNEAGAEFGSFDILKDNDVRQGLKAYSDWKTYPQLYVGGKLIGGHDIIVELAEESELKDVVSPATKAPPAAPSADDGEKKASTVEEIDARIKKIIGSARVVLFMKGSPEEPRCGFSRTICGILAKQTGVKFSHFDILGDDEVRQRIKVYSNWPTFPQLYVNGELVGGLDIVTELEADGELSDVLGGE